MYRTAPTVAAIFVVLALASCGGGSGSTAGGGSDATGSSSSATTPGGRPSARTTGQKTTAHAQAGQGTTAPAGDGARAGGDGACQASLGEFVGRMDDLRHSLLAGLSYDEYVVRVRAIRDAYEAVAVEKLAPGCVVGSASDAEAAFNEYLRAANLWGECAGTAGCAASEIEGRLQRRWRIASKSLEEVG